MRALAFAALLLSTPVMAQTLAPPSKPAAAMPMPDDPYLWLEDVNGSKPMAWVEAENARTVGVLEKDPRYPVLFQQALTIAEAKDRIPMPAQVGSAITNFWQDSEHVRGLWRRTTTEDYARPQPSWETLIDLDALARADKANWVWKGTNCEPVHHRRCLVQLSDGGEDAITAREFDFDAKRFVADGFNLPEGKQDVTWVDEDTLLVARDWGEGSMTSSGYPYIVKRLKRGQPLSAAVEVFRGKPTDVEVGSATLTDAQGHKAVVIRRAVDFFDTEWHLVTPRGVARLDLPLKSTIQDLLAGRLVVKFDEAWAPPGATAIPQGAVASLDLSAVQADPARLKPTLVFAPGPRQSVETVAASRGQLILSVYDNVRGRAYAYTPTAQGWTERRIPLPDNVSVDIASATSDSDRLYLSVTGYLDPTTLWEAEAPRAGARQIKALPARFDASTHVVEQFEATSRDGTRVPYFVVHPRAMKRDGSNPTLLYAYGGFQNSLTPAYSGTTGKLWLERGGTYVVANIRGGGEFGPAWHQAGLKTKRQVIYDDFAAVAQDLIARQITSPRRLGIRGGSNGGLLMGVQFEQHPELWNAVIIDVPLLDMLRIDKIAAGASWAGEYGELSDPAVRAFWETLSPYHNLRRDVRYPEPFIFTTTKDDRVGPVHARKFAARMKEFGLPYLFYENTEGGHAAGANLRQTARTNALEMTYLVRKLMD